MCCQRRSSRGTQILTRRSQSALGFLTATWAAQNGHLHILEYLVERKFDKYDEFACERAAEFGHLDCLKYLHETAKAPWNSRAVRDAHWNNHSECLQYLLDNNCPSPTRLAIRGRNFTHLIINTHTHTKERHTERKKYTIYACKKKRHTHPNICFRNFPRKTKQQTLFVSHATQRRV